MYVSAEAVSLIRQKRRAKFRDDLLVNVVKEAQKLGIELEELKAMLDNLGGAHSDRSDEN